MRQAARILVVDDDEGICDLLSSALERDGHRVDCAVTAADAHAALDQGHFDLALINNHMREDKGRDLAYRVLSSGAEVLLMTGQPDAIEREWGDKLPFIAKPFELTDCQQRVDLALRSLSAPEAIAKQRWHRTYHLW